MTSTLKPDIDAVCPFLPDEATDWERQEIDRKWRDALADLDRLRRVIQEEADVLLNRGTPSMPEPTWYGHEIMGGGLAYLAVRAEASMVGLSHIVNGSAHRVAWGKRRPNR